MLRFIDSLLNKTLNADGGVFVLARENPGVNNSDQLGGVREPEDVFQNKHVGKGKDLAQG